MTAEELLQFVPAELRYDRLNIPESQNAYRMWREALAAITPISDDLVSELRTDEETLYHLPFSSPAKAERAREELARNRVALALFEEALARPRLQLPERCGWNYEEFRQFSNHRDLLRWLQMRYKLACGEGRWQAAALDAARATRAGMLLCNGEGFVVDWIIGMSLWRIGCEMVARLADQPQLPADARNTLREAMTDSFAAPLGHRAALRVDLSCGQLVDVASFPDAASVRELVERYVTEYCGEPAVAAREDGGTAVAVDDRGTLLRQWYEEIFRGHRRPFGQADTTVLLGACAIAQLRDVRIALRTGWRRMFNPWERRVSARQRRLRRSESVGWLLPSHMLSIPGECFGTSDESRAKREECNRTFREAETDFFYSDPPTPTELELLRAQLAGMTNPFGNMLADNLASSTPDSMAVRLRNELVAVAAKLQVGGMPWKSL